MLAFLAGSFNPFFSKSAPRTSSRSNAAVYRSVGFNPFFSKSAPRTKFSGDAQIITGLASILSSLSRLLELRLDAYDGNCHNSFNPFFSKSAPRTRPPASSLPKRSSFGFNPFFSKSAPRTSPPCLDTCFEIESFNPFFSKSAPRTLTNSLTSARLMQWLQVSILSSLSRLLEPTTQFSQHYGRIALPIPQGILSQQRFHLLSVVVTAQRRGFARILTPAGVPQGT